ncbi:rhombosortase [Pseudorhodoferax sp. Leaf267]|uniref:rhombosortase n=1 Tax=Pseudorhodoferax sp. Leaf267 TaxID=1736316 RepID=UPI0012E0F793|nr:rhombosortase [Pseudorhodoferax sp. Leaf267]
MATLVAAVAVLGALQALPPAWHAALRYDRAALLQGELWRLWTGHLIHLGWAHWALNAAGLVLCGLLVDRPPGAAVLARRAACLGLGISLLFLLLVPTLSHYVGLSGVLYGLFVLGLWPGARRVDPVAIAALSTIAAWLCGQWLLGPDRREMELIGGPIIVQAHVFGVACAALVLAARRAGRSLAGT